MTASAGWYPQPDGSEGFWDGRAWTGQRRAPGPQDQPYGRVEPYPVSPQPYAAYPPPPGGHVVAPKSPALSLLVSFFVPGVGSMINGDVGKGVGILLLYLIGLPLCLILIGVPMVLGAWIWGMVDAYTGAQAWNYRHAIAS